MFIRVYIELVKIVKGQTQEIMFVPPGHLAFREVCTFSGRRRRVGDLSDKVRCRCLGNTIHQHTNVWDAQKNRESEGKAEENTFSIAEPPTLLLGGELNAPKVRFELEAVRISHTCGRITGLTSSRIRLRDAK